MNHSRKNTVIISFLLPSVILFMVFYAFPLGEVFVTSFSHWSIGSAMEFSGFQNYKELFVHNPEFYTAIKHTFMWLLLNVFISVPFSILIALVFAKKPRGWKFVRNSFVLPNIISSAAIAMIFMNMFDNDYGLVNSIVRIFNKDFNLSWYSDERTAFIAVTLSFLFFVGTNVLLIMAEVASIPDSLIESAKIDGATSFQIDLYIIIPMLRNIVGTVTILSASAAITQFNEVYILTRGGPGDATMNLGVFLYKTATTNNNLSLANTVGVAQILLGLVIIVIIGKIFRIGKTDE